jgi:hypothetical protein
MMNTTFSPNKIFDALLKPPIKTKQRTPDFPNPTPTSKQQQPDPT